MWHGQSVPLADVAQRAGHSRASFTLDVYTHCMPGDELPVERYLAILEAETCRPVMTPDAIEAANHAAMRVAA